MQQSPMARVFINCSPWEGGQQTHRASMKTAADNLWHICSWPYHSWALDSSWHLADCTKTQPRLALCRLTGPPLQQTLPDAACRASRADGCPRRLAGLFKGRVGDKGMQWHILQAFPEALPAALSYQTSPPGASAGPRCIWVNCAPSC